MESGFFAAYPMESTGAEIENPRVTRVRILNLTGRTKRRSIEE
jgi:hypothetical protein